MGTTTDLMFIYFYVKPMNLSYVIVIAYSAVMCVIIPINILIEYRIRSISLFTSNLCTGTCESSTVDTELIEMSTSCQIDTVLTRVPSNLVMF